MAVYSFFRFVLRAIGIVLFLGAFLFTIRVSVQNWDGASLFVQKTFVDDIEPFSTEDYVERWDSVLTPKFLLELPEPNLVEPFSTDGCIERWNSILTPKFLVEKSEDNPIEPISSESCVDRWESILMPKFISIRHLWGDQQDLCMPFSTNYTTLEMEFAPYYCLGKTLPMLDLRGHRFDDNTYAANAGLIGRYIPDPSRNSFCELLGFNVYYDYREGYIGYYNQIGAGLEILSKNWDFRANAYVPFGAKQHMQVAVYDACYTGGYTLTRNSLESLSYSFNAEVGIYLVNLPDSFSLYLAGGPYFIARDQQNGGVVGGEVRLRPQYKDYLAVDGSWRYDSLFETIWQIEVIVNLPLYQMREQNRGPCGISDRQIYQPVQRFEVLPLSLRNCWFSNF